MGVTTLGTFKVNTRADSSITSIAYFYHNNNLRSYIDYSGTYIDLSDRN